MTGSGSPCGACKFLRRKCVRGCVFAPYFCHEQGATHFAAIHKVFGASNVSKLLAHLPVSDRCEAALTISYEAQARLQDPIYGCVSHIFALQQQVVNLQAQLAYLKEQAGQSNINVNASAMSENPNGKAAFCDHDLQKWFLEAENPNMGMQWNGINEMDVKPTAVATGNYENHPESISISSFHQETCNSYSSYDHDMQFTAANSTPWGFHHHEVDDLQSVAFGYSGYSSSAS
ncbi:LOB domain-containing protein 29-like [Senna tora]|uniref:LOB domain-containing protein 29-like n=1 Tax=Senna tora TaxID=362788 RepID=A0A834WDB9_9FABA|nr:LOB domain-containing protein 29-like [Senna tora]